MDPTASPTAINVTLRVVGIQYHEPVTITVPNPTIKDLMEAARAKDDGRHFQYMTSLDGSLHSVSAVLPTAKASISSGIVYQPGLYALADDVGTNGQTSIKTWQWYVVRKENPDDKVGQQVNQPDGHVELFSLPKTEVGPPPQYRFLQDGDLVIWRLVVVAMKPTVALGQSSNASKVERLPTFVADPINDPVKPQPKEAQGA